MTILLNSIYKLHYLLLAPSRALYIMLGLHQSPPLGFFDAIASVAPTPCFITAPNLTFSDFDSDSLPCIGVLRWYGLGEFSLIPTPVQCDNSRYFMYMVIYIRIHIYCINETKSNSCNRRTSLEKCDILCILSKGKCTWKFSDSAMLQQFPMHQYSKTQMPQCSNAPMLQLCPKVDTKPNIHISKSNVQSDQGQIGCIQCKCSWKKITRLVDPQLWIIFWWF